MYMLKNGKAREIIKSRGGSDVEGRTMVEPRLVSVGSTHLCGTVKVLITVPQKIINPRRMFEGLQ